MRAALYARVSTEEQVEGYSIDAQRRAFQALVAARDWTPYKEYIEEGKTAHTDDLRKRPVFREAMDDALAGKYGVLVVHKIDRFSRKLRITLEYFEKLGKAGVGFVSIQNDMDYSTPPRKFMLIMQGGLAELYSDDLSEETKKGWAERRAQGLYCGLLPFGAMKGEDGVPVPDPDAYPGLAMAFELAARGESDTRVARELNAAGYRTAGNQGGDLFSNNTVRGVLTNKFYLGYLPNGNNGWIKAKHEAFIDEELWNLVQDMRRRNATSSHRYCTQSARICSFSGITYCWYCKGRIHVANNKRGKPRLGCYNRLKGWDCRQKSASLDVYEEQIREYIATFNIPDDYQAKILEAHKKLQDSFSDSEKERQKLESRLERIKELYKWGDLDRDEYLKEKSEIQRQLQLHTPLESSAKTLERLANFLVNVAEAWDEAKQEQRNKLARCLFQEVWVKDKQVLAVRPQPELAPFFKLNYEEFVNKKFESATPGGFEPPISTVTGWHVRPLHHGAILAQQALLPS
jgi:site-specific DNA recombinase